MKPEPLFTSDQHYGHANIIELANRPYRSVDHMNEELIRRHNARVEAAGGDDVDVYMLGDFAHHAHPRKVKECWHALRGRLHLTPGEHDKAPTLQLPWASPPEKIRTVWIGKQRIELCHYALRTWAGLHRHQALHFYGHSHGRLLPTERSIDVGVDVFDGAPASLEEILRKLKSMPRARIPEPAEIPGEEA
jgi:calcineurin-like phosphoesterase family protein